MEFREERVRITLHCSDQKKLTWGKEEGAGFDRHVARRETKRSRGAVAACTTCGCGGEDFGFGT
jgi:hypothetical protein